jgi:hypothetical protein
MRLDGENRANDLLVLAQIGERGRVLTGLSLARTSSRRHLHHPASRTVHPLLECPPPRLALCKQWPE